LSGRSHANQASRSRCFYRNGDVVAAEARSASSGRSHANQYCVLCGPWIIRRLTHTVFDSARSIFNTEKQPRAAEGHGESRMALRAKCPPALDDDLCPTDVAADLPLAASVALGCLYHEIDPPHLGGRSDRKKNRPQMHADSITYLRTSACICGRKIFLCRARAFVRRRGATILFHHGAGAGRRATPC
jgi:hypothetical protein